MDPFSLPLSPFERMMLAEDRPGFPQTAAVELDFEGQVDERRLREAWRAAIARHPLASARIAGRGRNAHWAPARLNDVLWISSPDTFDGMRQQPVDLTNTSGAQLEVCEGQGDVRMRFGLHHAVCDGAGAFQVLHDMLAAYSNLCQGRAPDDELPPRNASLLRSRHRFPYRREGVRRRLHDVYVGAREALKFAARSPVPLASTSGAEFTDDFAAHATSVRATAHTIMPRELVTGLRRTAARLGATVHDLLIRDAFVATKSWNAAQGGSHVPEELYRILSPCNLRTRSHDALPAANLMSYAFYTRRAWHCGHVESLTESVVAESNFIRDENASMYFIRCLETAGALPGVVQRLSSGSSCYATLVISNLGEPWRGSNLRRPDGLIEIGLLRLQSVRAFSPIRSGTNAAIVVCTYGGQATVGLSYNQTCWDHAAAEEFLNTYLRQLAISAGTNLNDTDAG